MTSRVVVCGPRIMGARRILPRLGILRVLAHHHARTVVIERRSRMPPSLKDLLDVATNAAYVAGRRTLAYFNAEVAVETKPDDTPVVGRPTEKA